MAFLQMAKAAGSGHILKDFSFCISKSAIGNEGAQIGIAGAKINVEPAVVIEIAKVRTHGKDHMVQAHLLAHVGKGPIMIVMVEFGSIRSCFMPQIIGKDVTDV